MWPGPSTITWQPCSQALSVSSPSVFSSANWASSLASARQPGRRPSPRLQVTSYARMISHSSSKCVYNGFCWRWAIIHSAISEPPRLTMPVTRLRRQRQVLEQHAGVDRHVIDALLRLVLDHVEQHAAA